MTARRRIFAFLLGATICFSAAPALASLLISGPMRATASLVTGPQFFGYASGTPVEVGTATNWEGFALDGLVIDPETGHLVLDRAGLLEPSGVPWWDPAFPTRVCGTLSVPTVEAPAEPAVEPDAPAEPPAVDDPGPADAPPTDPGTDNPAADDAGEEPEIVDADPDSSSDSDAPGRSDDRDDPDSDKPGLGGDRQDGKFDDPVTGEQPAEEEPAEEPLDDLTGEESPATEVPAEESPAEESLAEETPSEETPLEEPEAGESADEPTPGESANVLSAFTFDSSAEIEAGRLQPDLGDLRVVHSTTGALVSHRVLGPVPGSETVILVDAPPGADLCAYWGDPAAVSVEDLTLQAPIAADGEWTWERWDVAVPSVSLESVDWDAVPADVTIIATAETEPNDCDRCAHEVAGSIVPSETGEYRFHLSVNLHGRMEMAPREGATSLVPVVSVHSPVLPDVFDGPEQISEPMTLNAGEQYEIRVRSMDVGPDDHLQVAWSFEGEAPAIIEGEHLVDADGVPGGLTHRDHIVVSTTDFTDAVTETVSVGFSEIGEHGCESCLHRLGGFVLVEESATYRFWLSSNGEGTLEGSFTGDPETATPLATVPVDGAEAGNWDTFATQGSEPVALTAGQIIWLRAESRDLDGAGHLQVGWNHVGADESGLPVETPITLLPGSALSTSEPTPIAIRATPFEGIEGLFEGRGVFVSNVIDTTEDGSNVHGLVDVVANLRETDALDLRLAAAAAPEGPWEAVGPDIGSPGDGTESFRGGEPVPLAFDGLRYLRFEGTLTTTDRLLTPSLEQLRTTRDLVEAPSADAATSVAVTGPGDHLLFRVRGAAGDEAAAVIEVLPNGSVGGLTAETWLGPGRAPQVAVSDGVVTRGVGTPVPFDRAAPQHIGVSIVGAAQQATVRLRWIAEVPGGAQITHDIELVVAP